MISSRWVLRQKFTRTGDIGRRKARVVVRGFEQEAQLDYFDTFALVLRYTTLRDKALNGTEGILKLVLF